MNRSVCRHPLRDREVIFESDTLAGKMCDVALIGVILLIGVAVMLESMEPIRQRWGAVLRIAEWSFTESFTVEYALRLL